MWDGLQKEDDRGNIPFSSYPIKSAYSHHDLSLLMLTLIPWLRGACQISSLQSYSFYPSFLYCALWKEVTKHSPYLMRVGVTHTIFLRTWGWPNLFYIYTHENECQHKLLKILLQRRLIHYLHLCNCSIIYLCQYGFRNIYFIIWVITPYYFTLLLILFQLWPLRALLCPYDIPYHWFCVCVWVCVCVCVCVLFFGFVFCFFPFFFFVCVHSMWRFPGQGLNLRSDNARSSTCCTTRELHVCVLITIIFPPDAMRCTGLNMYIPFLAIESPISAEAFLMVMTERRVLLASCGWKSAVGGSLCVLWYTGQPPQLKSDLVNMSRVSNWVAPVYFQKSKCIALTITTYSIQSF